MLEIWGLGAAKHPCPQQLKSWAELCFGNVVNCSAAKQEQECNTALLQQKKGTIPDFPSNHLWECNNLWDKSHSRAGCTSKIFNTNLLRKKLQAAGGRENKHKPNKLFKGLLDQTKAIFTDSSH